MVQQCQTIEKPSKSMSAVDVRHVDTDLESQWCLVQCRGCPPCWGSHWASKSMLGLRGPPTVNTHVMEVLNMESLVASEAPSSYVNLAHKTIDQISPWWWLWGQRWRPHFCPTQQHLVFSPILTLTPISLLSFSTNGKNENSVLVMSQMILSRFQYLIT